MSVSHKTGVTPRKSNVTMFKAESNVGHKICRVDDLAINTLWAWMSALGVSRYHGLVSPAYGVYRQIDPSGFNSQYIDYLLRIPAYAAEYRCLSTGITSSRLRLYPKDFLRIPLIQPPRDEQDAIVRYLKQTDAFVRSFLRNRRRLVEVLTEQKQAIINHTVSRGLNQNVDLRDVGVGTRKQIPSHWERRAIGQLFSIGRGQVTSNEYIASHPGPYPLYSSQTSNDGVMGRIDTYMFDGEYLTWTTDGAHAGTVFLRAGKFNCTNVCGTLLPKEKMFLPFMKYALAIETKWHVRVDINPKLMNNMMARIRVNFPPIAEQIAICEYIQNRTAVFDRAIEIANAEIKQLNEFRDRLIANVVTGILDVRRVEQEVSQMENSDPFDEASTHEEYDESELDDEVNDADD